MYLLLDVSSTNPETNLECECALLDISRTFCDRLQRQVETIFRQRRELPDLHEVYFWRSAVEYYAYDLIAACDEREDGWGNRFHDAGRAVLPMGVDVAKFELQRTECQQEIVRYVAAASNIIRQPDKCFEFCWTAVPKHSDLYITTRDVTLPELRQYLAAEKKSPQPAKRQHRTKS